MMPTARKLGHIVSALVIVLGLGSYGMPASAKKVGVATAVNPNAKGTPPGAATRTITVGLGMIRDERVETGPVGRTQLLFLDGSAMTIGPSSDLVLDTFVYDPDKKAGELAVSVTRGLLRYVGGKISKKTPVTFQTPHATIGIRGGICLVSVLPTFTQITLLFGILTVTSGGVTKTLERAGFEITIEDPDVPPGAAVAVNETRLANTLTELEGVVGSNGGIPIPPTDSDVTATQIPSRGSDVAPTEVAKITSFPSVKDSVPTSPAGSETGDLSTPDEVTKIEATDLATTIDTDTARVDLVEASQTEASNAATAIPTPSPTILNTAFVGRVKFASAPLTAGTDEIAGTNFGFSSGTATGLPGTVSTNSSPNFIINIDSGTFAASTSTNGFGSTFTGTGTLTADEQFLYYLDLTDPKFDQVLAWAGIPTPASAMPTSGITYYSFQMDAMLNADVAFIPNSSVGGSGTAIINWGTQDFLASNVYISGSGATQDSFASVMTGTITNQTDPNLAAISGEFRGSAQRGTSDYDAYNGSVDTQRSGDGTDGDSFSTGIAFFGSTHPDYFVLGSSGGADSVVANTTTTYNPNTIAMSTSTSTSATRTTRTLSGYAAGVVQEFSAGGALLNTYMFQDFDVANGGNTGGSSVITTNATTGEVTATLKTHDLEDEVDEDFIIQYGGDGDATRHAFIDDDNYASIEKTGGTQTVLGYTVTSDSLYFTTAGDGLQTSGFLPAGVSFCTCSYLSWGFWGGTVLDASGKLAVMHLGTWVAGENAVSVPTSGVASYLGHIIGNVNNAGNLYLAAGKYQQTVSFGAGSHSSNITVTSFDSVNYSVTGAVNAGTTFSASLAPSDASTKVMSVEGSFFQGGGDQIQAVGGNFQIKNAGSIASSTYTATGIFAADKQ